jgi:hypothetical protein
MFLATSKGLIGASKVNVLLGVGAGFVDSDPSLSSCMMVYLVLLSLELLVKSLQQKLLVLQLVFALDVGLGFVPVSLDLHSDPLGLQSQYSQGCWNLSHQVCLGSDHLLLFLT